MPFGTVRYEVPFAPDSGHLGLLILEIVAIPVRGGDVAN